METDKINDVLIALSKIMDEKCKEESIAEQLFDEFEYIVNEKLIPLIGKSFCKNKYQFIESISNLCKDISLYLYFPSIINTAVIGIYKPKKFTDKLLCHRFIEESLLLDASSLSASVFTVINARLNQDQQIQCLNLSEKNVALTNGGYRELLNYAETEKLDLAGVSFGFLIPSEKVNTKQSYVVIPENIDVQNKYYVSLIHAVDILIVQAKECNIDAIKNYKYLSKLFLYGKTSKKSKKKIDKYCKRAEIDINYFNSLSEILDELSANQESITNFCYKYDLENIFYDILLDLSVRKTALEKPLIDINDNLLFREDEESYKVVKNLQKEYCEKIDNLMNFYTKYRNICEKLIQLIEQIQECFDIKEDGTYINKHIPMDKILFDFILKSSEIYKVFPELDSKGKLRNDCKIYKQNFGKDAIINVILNDFMGDEQSISDLEKFEKLQSDSIFYKRKKLKLWDKLLLESADCAEIIYSINDSLTGVEKRILGEHYLKFDVTSTAKRYLFDALRMGEEDAGNIIMDSLMDITEQERRLLADYGVKEAAFQIAEGLYNG